MTSIQKSVTKLEHFKPMLKKGKLLSRGNKVVLEIEEPFNQIILPLEMADLVTLCNGRLTVKQIIEKIFTKQKSVAFKNVCLTILNLKKQGFLVNGDELEDPEYRLFSHWSKAWFEKLFFPTFNWLLIKRITFPRQNIALFFFLCIGVLSTALSALSSLSLERLDHPFLWRNGSFLEGVVLFYLLSSTLLTSKTLFKFILLAIRTGRIYNLRLELSPIACYLKIDHEGSHLIDRINERCLYHLTGAAVYLPIAAVASALPMWEHLAQDILVVSLIMSLWDVNPFFRSEMSEFFKSIAPFDKNNPWFLVQGGYAEEKNLLSRFSSQIEYQVIYNFSWAAFSVLLSAKIAFETIPYLTYSFQLGSPTEKMAVMYIGYVIGILVSFAALNLLSILAQVAATKIDALKAKIASLRQALRVHKISRENLLQSLHSIPVLSWFSEEVLQEIVNESDILMFKDGMIVFNEGDYPDSLYILTHGSVRIYKSLLDHNERTKISTLKPISIFGETCLLNEDRRKAQAVAKGSCTVVKIPQKVLEKHFGTSQLSVDLESFRTSIMVDQFFHSAPIFSSMEPHAIQFLMSRGVVEEFDEETIVFHQGQESRDFYLIIRGLVDVEINGEKVNSIPQGGFFGEIGVIASIPRTATVKAQSGSVVLRVDSESFWEFMTGNLDVALLIETVGEIRLQQDIDFYTKDEKEEWAA